MMRSTLGLFRAVFHKQTVLLFRYPINTLMHILTMYLFFMLVFFGGREVVGASIDDSLGGIVVGFFLVTMVSSIFSSIAWWITMEAQWGTLEQLYMSPFGFETVMVARVTYTVLKGFVIGGVILVLMMVTTGRYLNVDAVTVVPILLFTLAPAVGLGFTLGGLALVYKRIESAFNLVEWGSLVLISASLTGFGRIQLLPFVKGTSLLRDAMSNGRHLLEFPTGELAVLVGTGAGYVLLGYLCFKWAQRRVLRMGNMGHY